MEGVFTDERGRWVVVTGTTGGWRAEDGWTYVVGAVRGDSLVLDAFDATAPARLALVWRDHGRLEGTETRDGAVELVVFEARGRYRGPAAPAPGRYRLRRDENED